MTAAQNLAGIRQAGIVAGNDDVTVIEYDGLNHMLNRSQTAAPDDSIALGETINPLVLRQVTRWLQDRAGLAPTAVEKDRVVTPIHISLLPNYPNPFNGQTLIRFALPQAGAAQLVLYDLAGQQVRVLASGQFETGSHVVTWDGHDAEGRAAASGVYLMELRSAGRVQRQALTLLQ